MKKTSLFMIAFVSATFIFTACGSGDSTETNTEPTTTDTGTENVVPAPMDTATTMPADTATMPDTTTK